VNLLELLGRLLVTTAITGNDNLRSLDVPVRVHTGHGVQRDVTGAQFTVDSHGELYVLISIA
jgi:hypothetical protein